MAKKVLKYSEAMSELDAILDDLQSERIDVDELSLKVRRAAELIKICKSKIHQTEMEVKEIVKEFQKDA